MAINICTDFEILLQICFVKEGSNRTMSSSLNNYFHNVLNNDIRSYLVNVRMNASTPSILIILVNDDGDLSGNEVLMTSNKRVKDRDT